MPELPPKPPTKMQEHLAKLKAQTQKLAKQTQKLSEADFRARVQSHKPGPGSR